MRRTAEELLEDSRLLYLHSPIVFTLCEYIDHDRTLYRLKALSDFTSYITPYITADFVSNPTDYSSHDSAGASSG